MKSFEKTSRQSLLGCMAFVLLVGLIAAPVYAAPVTLISDNSEVQIDPTSDAGLYLWKVDGANYDAKQWFWYRLGTTGGEQPLNSLTMNGLPVVTDSDGDLVKDTAFIKYTSDLTNHGLNINVTFSLLGSGAGTGVSSIAEQIRIENKSADTMDMHFFQYNNFILSNGQDTVTFDGNNHVVQTGPVYQLGELIGQNGGEGIVTGFPKHEAALVSTTLNSLTDVAPTNFLSSMTPWGRATQVGPFSGTLPLARAATSSSAKIKT
jgi:hypothetical protein